MSWLCLGNCGTTLSGSRDGCLVWYPGDGCLLGSIRVSCKEKGLLLGTLPWHKMGAKLFRLRDLEL